MEKLKYVSVLHYSFLVMYTESMNIANLDDF